jgi:hypothetical protein
MRLPSSTVYGDFLKELNRRNVRISRNLTRELPKLVRDDIASVVDIKITELVLDQRVCRKTEVLEVAFAQTVTKLTLQLVRKYEFSPWSRRAEIPPPGDEDSNADEIEDPLDLVADDGDGPEVQTIQKVDNDHLVQKLKQAYAAVKDPVDLKAFKLHYEGGLPIYSKDPDKPDVVSEVGETRGQVNYRISTALKQIRKALGGQK